MIKRRPPSADNARRLAVLGRLGDGGSFFEPYVVQADLINLRRLCERRGFTVEIRKTVVETARSKRQGCRITRRNKP